jgi:hypothetical protein
MFTLMLAAYGSLMSPAPELTQAPLRHVPRMLQVATVPGTAPLPLAQPPAVLRLSVTPPAPQAPYVVVCTFDGSAWRGVTPEGWTVGLRPYTDNSWSQNPVDTSSRIRQGFHYCLIQCVNGASHPYDGRIYVTSDSPYSSGPAPVIWQLGSTVRKGYTLSVSQ